MTTVLTARGQTSVPAKLRRKDHLEPGQRLRWYRASEKEYRVVIESCHSAPGPLAGLGYAMKFHPDGLPTTAEAMKEIREGDEG